jgi:hypothetical protein
MGSWSLYTHPPPPTHTIIYSAIIICVISSYAKKVALNMSLSVQLTGPLRSQQSL